MTRPTDADGRLSRKVETHRSLFLSDFHLGARGCRADRILDFLNRNNAETIYLVGDILDTWHPLVPHWTESHDAILRLLLRRARQGARIVYLPGNHDHPLRGHYGTHLAGIEVAEQAVHRAADGRSYLVLHGDRCDKRLFRSHLATRIGSRLDGAMRTLDGWLRGLRGSLRPEDRSVIEVLLVWVGALMHFGGGFEMRVTDLAREQGWDGVICGHTHRAALHDELGILYGNCGDWVDSLTAIVEDAEGRLELVRWEELARDPVREIDFDAVEAPGIAGLG